MIPDADFRFFLLSGVTVGLLPPKQGQDVWTPPHLYQIPSFYDQTPTSVPQSPHPAHVLAVLTRAQRSPSSAPHTGWTRGRSRCNKSKMRCPDWHSAACPRFAVSQGSGRVHLRCHCVSMVTAEPGGWRFLEGWSQRRHHRGWCNSRCTFLPEVPSRPRL